LQKEYETIIQTQAEALERIETYAQHLKEALPLDSPYISAVEQIEEESRKRI
jgi:hypothetical protein